MADARWERAEYVAENPYARPEGTFGSLDVYTQESPASFLISMAVTFLLTLLTVLMGVIGVIGGKPDGVKLAVLGPPIEIVLGTGAAASTAVAEDGSDSGEAATMLEDGTADTTNPEIIVGELNAELGKIPDANASIKVDKGKAKRKSDLNKKLADGIQIDGIPDATTVGGGVPISGIFRELIKDSPSMVFVLDKSGSMAGTPLQSVIAELEFAINGLKEEQKFFVIFFDHTTWPMFSQYGHSAFASSQKIVLLPATAAKKQDAIQWIRSIQGDGGTDPSGGMLMALDARPHKIILLSDGEFSPLYIDEIRRRNTHKTIIDCIGLSEDIQTLQQIAAENSGKYHQAR